jgi:phage-related protein
MQTTIFLGQVGLSVDRMLPTSRHECTLMSVLGRNLWTPEYKDAAQLDLKLPLVFAAQETLVQFGLRDLST